MKRHGLKARRVHGKAASAPKKAVKDGRAQLQELTSQYKPSDVFNLDKSAFFYCTAASTTISKSNIAYRKKQKKRLTVAIASNTDGSTKLPLMFVSTARRPRCFGSISTAELGVDYTSAPKGWMTAELFGAWLQHFDAQMREDGRSVLPLLDNALAHRVETDLTNVTIHFYPQHHRPPPAQDAGVIWAFKSEVNKLRNAHVVDELDRMLNNGALAEKGSIDIDRLYSVSVLEEKRWDQQAWGKVCRTTVSNSWRHTGILATDIYKLIAEVERLRIDPLSIE